MDNTIFYEEIKEKFDALVRDEDWSAVNSLMLDLQEKGMGHLELELMDTLQLEDLDSYTKWQRSQDGGDIAYDQMAEDKNEKI